MDMDYVPAKKSNNYADHITLGEQDLGKSLNNGHKVDMGELN